MDNRGTAESSSFLPSSGQILAKAAAAEGLLPLRLYVGAIGGWLLAGLGLSVLAGSLSHGWRVTWWMSLLILAFSIGGSIITARANNWPTAALGFVVTSSALGLLVGPFTARFTSASVTQVVMLTAVATVGLSTLGILIPRSLAGWGSYLFGGLLVVIGGQLLGGVLSLFGVRVNFGWLDWFAAILFTLYIVYDWNRGMRLRPTMHAAVAVASTIFVDVINLFVRLLLIFGNRH